MKRLPFLSIGVLALSALISGHAGAADGVPQGLYVGYYQEDPLTNPEDPTMGSLYLSLPAADSRFAGSMSFTYLGCQSDGVGGVSGAKSGKTLKGEWRGPVDGTEQNGGFAGAWSDTVGGYAGDYSVAGGKQHIDIPSCISYDIAPKGTFELFPVDAQIPAGFAISVIGREVRWTPPAGTAMTLVYVLDPELAVSRAGRAAKWQTLLFDPRSHAADLRAAGLKPGHAYIAVVSASDASFKRLAFASLRFTAS